MSKCLNCDVPIETNTGRRPRKFCGDNCRATYYQKNKPKEKKFVQRATYEKVFEKNKELETQLSELLSKNREEIKQSVNDILDSGIAITETTEEGTRRIDPRSEEGLKVQEMAKHQERIKQLESELKNPPKTAIIGIKNWIKTRKQELEKLKNKL